MASLLGSTLWAGRRSRSVLWQALAVAGVLLTATWLIGNAAENLARLKIASGFEFLGTAAGFDIAMSLIPYDVSSSYGRAFVVGLLNTLLISAMGIVFATALGFTVGIARLSRNWLVARLAAVYIETLRNIPLLLQLFFWYFAVLRALPSPRQSLQLAGTAFLNNRGLYLPAPVVGDWFGWFIVVCVLLVVAAISAAVMLRRNPAVVRASLGTVLGILAALVIAVGAAEWDKPSLRGFNFRGGIVLIPELVALTLALSIYTAAFIAENVRSGLESVSRGQIEAARALGLSEGQTLRLVIVPLALRVIVPPLTNQYLNLIKNSSLAAAIAYPDLVSVFAGTVLNQTGQAVEVIAITMAVYLAISLSISVLMNAYNRCVTRTGL